VSEPTLREAKEIARLAKALDGKRCWNVIMLSIATEERGQQKCGKRSQKAVKKSNGVTKKELKGQHRASREGSMSKFGFELKLNRGKK